jgi:hypothetical protein
MLRPMLYFLSYILHLQDPIDPSKHIISQIIDISIFVLTKYYVIFIISSVLFIDLFVDFDFLYNTCVCYIVAVESC